MGYLPEFPKLDVIPAENPLVEQINLKNIKVSFGQEAQERVKRQWDYPKRDVSLKYPQIPKADALTIWNFYIARGGSWEAFKYFHPLINIYEEEFVAIGNDQEYVFDLPAIESIDYTLYLNGIPQNTPADYTFGAYQGANGEDAVEFAVIPEVGSIITWSFTGKLVQRCRFDSDTQDFETFNSQLSKIGIKLKGLLLSEEFGAPTVTTTTTTT